MKEVKAIILTQKRTKLYCFTMDATELQPLCFVEAYTRTRDNLRGMQRVTEPSRLREIGEYIKQDKGLLPNNIILNLTKDVEIIPDGDGKTATIRFPSDSGDYAFVVDGQHRIFSFQEEYRRLSKTESFELPIVAFHNASEQVVGETFVSINVNQKPVNKDLLTQMKAILGLLETDIDNDSIDLINAIDEESSSPLHNRILRFPKEKNKLIKTNQLNPIIKGLLSPGGCLYEKNKATRKQILIDYLIAISKVFPDAWSDQKQYALLQASSLQILLSLLPDIMQRCDFQEGFSYNVDTFSRQIGPLADAALINKWKRSAVDPHLKTGKDRTKLYGQLKELLKIKPPAKE